MPFSPYLGLGRKEVTEFCIISSTDSDELLKFLVKHYNDIRKRLLNYTQICQSHVVKVTKSVDMVDIQCAGLYMHVQETVE